MRFLLYDKLRGPLHADMQPDAQKLKAAGSVTVLYKYGPQRYSIWFEEESKRVWALPEEKK